MFYQIAIHLMNVVQFVNQIKTRYLRSGITEKNLTNYLRQNDANTNFFQNLKVHVHVQS